jgi:hypothetical protein
LWFAVKSPHPPARAPPIVAAMLTRVSDDGAVNPRRVNAARRMPFSAPGASRGVLPEWMPRSGDD